MKTVVFFVSLVLVGLPLCLGASISLLTIFNPEGQWEIPPITDFILAGAIFVSGVLGLVWLRSQKNKEPIRRVWPEVEVDRHSGLRRR